ncbi:GerMN domain-containing protein [Desulfothermobacter acidiphilus]|uniref:GerMN domain-containing protein n=1 Tax=Desulfothermobacter acidiphilus TaxID=1938353 RepID=UPI003F8BB40B
MTVRYRFLMAGLVLLMFACLAGCGRGSAHNAPSTETPPAAQEKPSPTPFAKRQVTLYFADREAQHLVPEVREVEVGDHPLEQVVVEELIKGPTDPSLCPTIPAGTKLLSLEVKDGVAYVNFSSQFKQQHSGGSAGELMTIYSVVDSLARLGTVHKVQFLLEGRKEESILGHMDTSVPIDPDWSLVAKS